MFVALEHRNTLHFNPMHVPKLVEGDQPSAAGVAAAATSTTEQRQLNARIRTPPGAFDIDRKGDMDGDGNRDGGGGDGGRGSEDGDAHRSSGGVEGLPSGRNMGRRGTLTPPWLSHTNPNHIGSGNIGEESGGGSVWGNRGGFRVVSPKDAATARATVATAGRSGQRGGGAGTGGRGGGDGGRGHTGKPYEKAGTGGREGGESSERAPDTVTRGKANGHRASQRERDRGRHRAGVVDGISASKDDGSGPKHAYSRENREL